MFLTPLSLKDSEHLRIELYARLTLAVHQIYGVIPSFLGGVIPSCGHIRMCHPIELKEVMTM